MAEKEATAIQPKSSDLTRVVLEGVPRVNFYEGGERCPEDFTFPSSLRACLEYMGENFGCDHFVAPQQNMQLCCTYAYIMSACGYAFSLAWRPGWHMDNNSILLMSADPDEPFRRAFQAVGHSHEIISKQEGQNNEARFRRSIIESISRKSRPVIGFGIIGPPECCIITGYDEDGDIIIGWNFFQSIPNSTQAPNSSPQATSGKETGSKTHIASSSSERTRNCHPEASCTAKSSNGH